MSRTILCAALFLTTTPLLAAAGSTALCRAPAAAEAIQESGGQRGYLGVSVSDSEDGVWVTEVMPGGGAAAAGIQEGDKLVAVGESPIESFADLRRELDPREPGQTIPLTVRRGEEELHLAVVLGAGSAAERPRMERRPRSAALEELLRRREEFERSWRAEFEVELDKMRGRFEDGWGKLADELRESMGKDDEARPGPELEGLKKELEGWKRERLQALEHMRSALQGRAWGRSATEDGEGDEPRVWFYSPDGDGMFGQGWPGAWSGGGRGHGERPLMALPHWGQDLDTLRESVDELREQVRDLRAEIDELRERRPQAR